MSRISTKELQEISHIMERWHWASGAVATIFKYAEDRYLRYRFYRDVTSSRWKYNPVIPLVFTFVENYAASLINTIFDKPRVVACAPTEQFNFTHPMVNDAELARQLETAVNTLWLDPDRDLYEEITDVLKNYCIFGNSFSINTPIFDFDDWDPNLGPRFAGSKLECVDFFDIVPDPAFARMKKSRYHFHKEWISLDELKRREKEENYKNTDKVEDPEWLTATDYRESVMTRLGAQCKREAALDTKNKNVLLLHHWIRNANGTMDVVTVAGNSVIVRDSRQKITIETPAGIIRQHMPIYPYDPYADIRMFTVPKEFYAIGLAEIAAGAQEDMELFASMRLENIALALQKPFLATPYADIDIDNVLFAPDNIILTNDINALKQLEVADVTSGSFQEMAMRKTEAEDGTGMMDIMRGQSPARRETATTTLSLGRAGMKRVENQYKYLNRAYIAKEAKKTIIQTRRYMTQEEFERLTGKPDAGFFMLSEKEILRGFDFSVSSSSLTQIKELEQQAFVQAFQALSASPVINQVELARYFFELFMPQINPDRFILQQMPMLPGMPPTIEPTGNGGLILPKMPQGQPPRALPPGVNTRDIRAFMGGQP